MHKIVFVFMLILSTKCFSQVFKPVKDTVILKEKILNISKQTNSLESDFTQVKDLSMLSEKITSRGHFYFKKENQLRWEYATPYSYIIVINKQKVLIKDEKKLKTYDMQSNKVFKEINDIMISCVNGSVLNSKKFTISYAENEKNYKLELTPQVKQMKETLKKINMYFDKTVSTVVKLEMMEVTDDMTTIDFFNKKINADIPAEKFMLK